MKKSKIRELSKGMVTQLHLAIIMAVDAKLLVLDEPTLGLDILFRKEFYSNSVATLLAFVTDTEIFAIDHKVHGNIEYWLIVNHLYGACLARNKGN